MSRFPRLRGERGYTLVEMLTVLVIMSVVITSLTTVFVQASNSETDMNNRFQAQLTAKLALFLCIGHTYPSTEEVGAMRR